MKSLSNLQQELTLAELDIHVCETAVANGLTHFFKVEPGKRPVETSVRSHLAGSRRVVKRAGKRLKYLSLNNLANER